MYKQLIVELIVFAVQPYPWFWDWTFKEYDDNYKFNAIQFLNDLFLSFMLLTRVYLILRFIMGQTYFMSSRAMRVSFMNGHQVSMSFSMKCIMQDTPVSFVCWNLVISMIIFGYSMRIFDQGYLAVSGQDFIQIQNPLWMSIITMTTVGYGDFFPKSNISRVIGVICAFYGVFLVSLFVTTLINFLTFDTSEERAYELSENLMEKEQLLALANNVIVAGFKKRKAKRKNPNSKSTNYHKLKKYRGEMLGFQQHLKKLRGSQQDSEPDKLRRELNYLKQEIEKSNDLMGGLLDHFKLEPYDPNLLPPKEPEDVPPQSPTKAWNVDQEQANKKQEND